MTASSPLIVALDYPDKAEALQMADQLNPEKCRVKVGKELFTASGYTVIEALMAKGFDIFLDLKFHDIPSTTAKAVCAAAKMGVWMINVHACGGRRMMEACREALEQANVKKRPFLIAVTVLTSMTEKELKETGMNNSLSCQIRKLAALTQKSGLDGVVCPAAEVSEIKKASNKDFLCVTPGIRPSGHNDRDDQRQILTPEKALKMGADYLVIGRPVTRSLNPSKTIRSIIKTLSLEHLV